MIEHREGRDRITCPHCGAFQMEIKPGLRMGQSIARRCPRCLRDFELTKTGKYESNIN